MLSGMAFLTEDMSSSGLILQTLGGAFAVPYILYPRSHECLHDCLPNRSHFTMCNPPFYASLEELAQSTGGVNHFYCRGNQNDSEFMFE